MVLRKKEKLEQLSIERKTGLAVEKRKEEKDGISFRMKKERG